MKWLKTMWSRNWRHQQLKVMYAVCYLRFIFSICNDLSLSRITFLNTTAKLIEDKKMKQIIQCVSMLLLM